MAALPDETAIRAVLTAHLSVTAEAANGAGHLTLALSRSGGAAVTQGDEEWADALDAALDDLDGVPRAPTSPPTDGSHPS